jgi:hypothetical protein
LPRRSRPLSSALAALAAASGALLAQNRLINPDFDGSPGTLAGWVDVFPGTLAVADEDGHFGPACPNSDLVAGDSTFEPEFDAQLAYVAQCLAVAAGETLHLSAEVHVSRAAERILHVEFYSQEACFNVDPVQVDDLAFPGEGGWAIVAGAATAPAEATWMALAVAGLDEAIPGEPFEYRADRIYLGTLEPIFLDTFEGGATCRWSAAVGDS